MPRSSVRSTRCSALGALLALAPAAAGAAPPCTLGAAPETVTAVRALDGDTVALADGREVRLAGVLAPKPPLGARAKDWPPDATARRALDDEVAGRALAFRAAGDPDRHGRLVGWLAERQDPDDAGVATGLLERGFVWAAADRAGRDCNATLLRAEAAARSERLGLWSDPYYEVRDAADGPALAGAAGRFVVAEGRVASVRAFGGRTYVNFGRRWRDALALTISESNLKRLGGRAGLGLEAGARLRVRGVVEGRLGPTIAVTETAQIERLGGAGK